MQEALTHVWIRNHGVSRADKITDYSINSTSNTKLSNTPTSNTLSTAVTSYMSSYLCLSIINMAQCNTNTQRAEVRNNNGGVKKSCNISLSTLFLAAADISETFFWITKYKNISQCFMIGGHHTYIQIYIGMYIHACNYLHMDLNVRITYMFKKNIMMKATPLRKCGHTTKTFSI